MMKKPITLLFYLFLFGFSFAQTSTNWDQLFARYSADSLRGSNTEFRNWWNVLRYDLVYAPNFKQKSLEGTITIQLETILEDSEKIMQIDLQEPMKITKIVQLVLDDSKPELQNEIEFLPEYWKRNKNIYLLNTNHLPNKNLKNFSLKFYFEGNPIVAKNAPWDGGWIFTRDEQNRPWMSVAVQGIGASLWFPNKDYQGDEPDLGVTQSIIVPEDLVAVANGRMWETSFVKGEPGTNVYTWEVKNPINNYNIVCYIGNYEHFGEQMNGKSGELDLDYWVLDYNLEKAKNQFKQVIPMLNAFEEWMGPYPFYEDSFKLVESPYLGMEHQSAIAYGNQYVNGYLGYDTSGSGYGDKFDFIIVHETGHEWFGNNITTADIADMWVHEGFTTYSEIMYVENMYGNAAANLYAQGYKENIENDKPVIGTYGINNEGSIDMYYKGALMIHTLRQLMENDKQFKQMIFDLNSEFRHQTVTGKTIEDFISNYTQKDLTAFFNQYLRTTKIPILETKKVKKKTWYRYTNVVDDFDMPIKLKNSEEWLFPTTEWKKFDKKTAIEIDPNFLVIQK